MARKNLYDVLDGWTISYRREFVRLLELFTKEICIYSGYGQRITLASYVESYFRTLPVRKTMINVTEFLEEIMPRTDPIELDGLLLFCEGLMALLPIDKVSDEDAKNQRNAILDNIYCICEKTNHKVIVKENGASVIIEDNKYVTQVVQLIDDSVLCMDILDYCHFSKKGHVEDKRTVLASIGQYVEPIINALKKSVYSQLADDASFLLNNLHIRHNNIEGKNANVLLNKLSNEELEEWYDSTYNTLLMVIMANEQLSISKGICVLKGMME